MDAVSALSAEPSPEERSDRTAGHAGPNDTPSEPWALIQIVRDLWHYRELLLQLTLRDIRLRYKQAVMGFGWAIFMPLLSSRLPDTLLRMTMRIRRRAFRGTALMRV